MSMTGATGVAELSDGEASGRVPAAKRRSLIEGSWAFMGQVGSGLMLLAGTRLITELVSPEVFGQVALLNGLVGLGVSLFAYPFVSAGMRLLPEFPDDGGKGVLFQSLKRLMGGSTVLALVILALAGTGFVYRHQADPQPFLAAALLLIVTMRRELGIHLLIGQRRQREASLWQTGDSLLRPALAVLLVYWAGAEPAQILLGYCLAGVLANAAGGRFHRDLATARQMPAALRAAQHDILRYALPLIPMEMLSWFNALGDRYVIGYFLGPQEVGIYAAAYTLTNEAFHRAAIVLLRTFQPVYFDRHAHGHHREAFKVFKRWLACVLMLGSCGVAALFLLKDWVAALLLARVFRGAAELMPIIGLGCALQAVGTVLAQPLYAGKTTRRLLAGRMVGATTAAVSLPLMVQWQGLMGAAYAAPLYYGAEALTLMLIARPWAIRR